DTRQSAKAPLAANAPERGGGRGQFPGGGQGRGGRGGPPRFQTLTVPQAEGAAATEAGVRVTPVVRAHEPAATVLVPGGRGDAPAARLLPPGLSADAQGESVAVSGTIVEVDRAQMQDRLQALG